MIHENAYYHGTSESSAVSLIRDGIKEAELQSFDHGFYGEGFYVTESFLHAKHYGRAVVRLEFPTDVRVFDASPIVPDGARKVTGPDLPSWYNEYMGWFTDNRGTLNEVNPSSPDYSRDEAYHGVTAWAASQGYGIVHWNEHENIAVDYDAPERIVPDNQLAESAAREAGVWGG